MPEYAIHDSRVPVDRQEERAAATLLHQAARSRAEGDYEEAEKLLCKAIAQAPGHTRCLLELALCLAEGPGRFVSAEKLARRAMYQEPENPDCYFVLGKVNLLGHRHERAARYLDQALRLDPANNIYRMALESCPRPDSGQQKSQPASSSWPGKIRRYLGALTGK